MKQPLSSAFFSIPFIAIAFIASIPFSCAQGNRSSPSQKQAGAFVENFTDSTSAYFYYGSVGSKAGFKYRMGESSPTEPGSKILSFRIDPADSAGAGRGPEIISRDLTHFGTYSARIKVAHARATQPDVGAVTGYFTYHVDSLAGLSEIDFEWLLADPAIIYIGTWTGREGKLERVGRTINLAKGLIYSTEYRQDYTGVRTPLTGRQNQPQTLAAIEGYDASARFHTYGFDWSADRIRWWIIHPRTGEKIVLWDYHGTARGIPLHRSRYRINFWHTDTWAVETNPHSVEKPLRPYLLEVDWMSYDPAIGG